MDLPDLSLDKETLIDALYESRPLKAARMLLGPEKLHDLIPALPTSEEVANQISNSAQQAQMIGAMLADKLDSQVLSPIQAAALAQINPEHSKQASYTYGLKSQMGSQSPMQMEMPNNPLSAPVAQGYGADPRTTNYVTQANPQRGTAPAGPGTQYGSKLAFEEMAMAYDPAMALGDYGLDTFAGAGSSPSMPLTPNQALGLAGTAGGAYMLNNARSTTQARKRIASVTKQYLEAINQDTLTPEKLKLLNKELKILGGPGRLVAAENPQIAKAYISNLESNLAKKITSGRLRAIGPLAASAAMASLIYNNLSPNAGVQNAAQGYY